MFTEITRKDVQRLAERGAQLVDVLAATEYKDSHLPGAVHIPLARIPVDAGRLLEAAEPTITYCYDSLCDLSPRAAARLESIGFTDVYDYVASKVDWMGAGLPFQGTRAEQPHLASLADRNMATCRLADTTADVRKRVGDAAVCIVVDDHGIVTGLVRQDALGVERKRIAEVMHEAPRTFRPHVTATEMGEYLEQLSEPWVLVTNLDGTLVGLADVDRIRRAAHDERTHAA